MAYQVNYRQLYKSCTTCKERASVTSEFALYSIHDLSKKPKQMLKRLAKVDAEANLFNLDIIDGYRLSKGWFRNILAQQYPNDNTRILFRALKWDFEDAFDPKYNHETTIEYLGIRSTSGVVPIKVRMDATGAFPIGSTWTNGRSGITWRVIESFDNGLVEFEWIRDGFVPNVFVNKRNLNKYWIRVKNG